jgi:medium-chain acyl-[acyl-carrier-protein] hydrolase
MATLQQATPMSMNGVQHYWLRRSTAPDAKVRLFCFPYAGGSSRIYRNWQDWLAPEVEVVAVELPGRGVHIRGDLIDDIEVLVARFIDVASSASDLPFAVFGYSMGALIALEVCRRFHLTSHAKPIHLFAAAMSPPHIPSSRRNINHLGDEEFIEELRALRGTPQEVFENPELLQLVLPVLRSDFRMVETYRCGPALPLNHPITVFGGIDDDTIPCDTLSQWKIHSLGECTVRLLPGDHFFIHQHEHLIAASVLASLRSVLYSCPALSYRAAVVSSSALPVASGSAAGRE